jgi:hypothetical protein
MRNLLDGSPEFQVPAASVAMKRRCFSDLLIEGKTADLPVVAKNQASIAATSCCYHRISLGAENPWVVFAGINGSEVKFYAMKGSRVEEGKWCLAYRMLRGMEFSLRRFGDCLSMFALSDSMRLQARDAQTDFQEMLRAALNREQRPVKWWLDDLRTTTSATKRSSERSSSHRDSQRHGTTASQAGSEKRSRKRRNVDSQPSSENTIHDSGAVAGPAPATTNRSDIIEWLRSVPVEPAVSLEVGPGDVALLPTEDNVPEAGVRPRKLRRLWGLRLPWLTSMRAKCGLLVSFEPPSLG